MYKVLLALLAIAAVANCQQNVLIPSHSLASAEVESHVSYTATLYYGTRSDACLLDDDEEGSGTGILFEESGFDNVCLSYKDNVIYMKGYTSDTTYLLVRAGYSDASLEILYKPTSTEKVKFSVGSDYDTGMTATTSEKFDTPFILSVQDVKDTYGSSYALDLSWMDDYHEVTEYTVEAEIEKGGDIECINPHMGRLVGYEICAEWSTDGYFTVTADANVVGIFEVSGSTITFMYQNVDDFIYITRSGSAQSVYYVSSSQVIWVANEGSIPINSDNNVYDFSVTNADDDEDGYTWSCINVFNPESSDSILYQQVQVLCGICFQDEDFCEVRILMRDQNPQTLTAFEYLDDTDIVIEYDAQYEQVTLTYGDIQFTYWADELLIYSLEGDDHFEYRALVGDINFASDDDLDDATAQSSYDADGLIENVQFLSDDDSECVFDIYCNEEACYIGRYLSDSEEFEAAKIYYGNFETLEVYYVFDDSDEPETCLSLYTSDHNINDCGFDTQWEMYYFTFLRYPLETLDLSEEDEVTVTSSDNSDGDYEASSSSEVASDSVEESTSGSSEVTSDSVEESTSGSSEVTSDSVEESTSDSVEESTSGSSEVTSDSGEESTSDSVEESTSGSSEVASDSGEESTSDSVEESTSGSSEVASDSGEESTSGSSEVTSDSGEAVTSSDSVDIKDQKDEKYEKEHKEEKQEKEEKKNKQEKREKKIKQEKYELKMKNQWSHQNTAGLDHREYTKDQKEEDKEEQHQEIIDEHGGEAKQENNGQQGQGQGQGQAAQ